MPGIPVNPPSPEDPGARVVSLVRFYVGCSLHSRKEELAALVDFPGDDPALDVEIHTNCAMFVCGIWRALGCLHPLLLGRYVNGRALAWALKIASDAGAVHKHGDGRPGAGDVVHYATPGKNNDHLEFILTDPDRLRQCQHAGAGRADNAVTETTGDYSVNAWRPLAHWISAADVLAYRPGGS